MYGKHFASMYTGSMVGMGALAFAVMGYAIANQYPDREHGSVVEINPRLLGMIFGESATSVRTAIEKLCMADPDSRSKEEEGRRLVYLGQFTYRVVNGEKYRKIRNREQRQEQVRLAVAKHRGKKKAEDLRNHPGDGREQEAVKAAEDGNEAKYNDLTAPKAQKASVVERVEDYVSAQIGEQPEEVNVENL